MFKKKLSIIKIVNYFVKTNYNTFVYKCKFNFLSSAQLVKSLRICQFSVFFVSLLSIMNLSLFEIFRVCTCFQTIFVYVRVSIISIILTFVFVSIYTEHENYVYQLVNSTPQISILIRVCKIINFS